MLNSKIKILIVIAFSLVFLLLNYFFIAQDNYYFFAIPLLIIGVLVLLFAQEYAYWAILFFAPLSVNFDKIGSGFGIAIPTEPLLVGLFLFFIVKLFRRRKIETHFLSHPIVIAIFFYLAWMLFTSFSSEMPLVSFKYFIARLWFVFPLVFMAYPLYKSDKNVFRFFWISIIALALVIVYTTIMHSQYAFSEEVGRWIMSPFYNDHTAYGMAIALFLPIVVSFLFWNKSSRKIKMLAFGFLILFLIGFYLSFSRAAWLSILISLVVFAFLKFKIRFRYLLFVSLSVLLIFIIKQESISNRLSDNNSQSSEDFVEHLESSSNIMTDASNLERINRWKCALRLFDERKVLGWGPGTYQFVYGPMQQSADRTIISTNSGDGGTAHSEYLGPLAESGILGLISILAVFLSLMTTGFRLYRTAKTENLKFIALVSTLALSTYLSHGFLNNFLDTDKASIPFWTFAAVLIAIDLKNSQLLKEEG